MNKKLYGDIPIEMLIDDFIDDGQYTDQTVIDLRNEIIRLTTGLSKLISKPIEEYEMTTYDNEPWTVCKVQSVRDLEERLKLLLRS